MLTRCYEGNALNVTISLMNATANSCLTVVSLGGVPPRLTPSRGVIHEGKNEGKFTKIADKRGQTGKKIKKRCGVTPERNQ